ncbi:MAG: hypothetical protein HY925_14105 [Elusimicrobia bacterium]|nr:hypothetical protein [Elusimicrobiota bacterium]
MGPRLVRLPPPAAVLLWALFGAPWAARAQTPQADCAGTIEALSLSHPHLRCRCPRPDESPDCSDERASAAAPSPRSGGSVHHSGPSFEQQLMAAAMSSFLNALFASMQAPSGPSAEELRAQAQKKWDDYEKVRLDAEKRIADKAFASKKTAALGLLGGRSAPAPAAAAMPPPEAPRPAGRAPQLLRGDPAAECRGKRPSLACPDLAPRPVPPLGDSRSAKAAEEDGRRLQRELDARRAAEAYDAMESKLKKYAASEYARAGWEKTKEFIEDRSEALGRHISTLERVKEQGAIVKDFATNTLDAFKDKASSAACVLGAGSAACIDAYHSAVERQKKGVAELNQSTHDFMAEQFLVPSAEDEADETLGDAKEKLSGAAVHGFFSRFER